MSYDLNNEEQAIAEGVITELAPDELPLLQQLMTRPRWRDRLQGKSIGYGIDSALPVIAPYVLVVVVWARSVVTSEAKNVMELRLRALTRRLLLVHEPKNTSLPPLPKD